MIEYKPESMTYRQIGLELTIEESGLYVNGAKVAVVLNNAADALLRKALDALIRAGEVRE